MNILLSIVSISRIGGQINDRIICCGESASAAVFPPNEHNSLSGVNIQAYAIAADPSGTS